MSEQTQLAPEPELPAEPSPTADAGKPGPDVPFDVDPPAPDPANPFTPAARTAQKARVAFFGPSKSGKTMSALLTARGIIGDGRIAVIDTEGGRVNLYAGLPPLATEAQPQGFDTITMEPPFHPQRVEGGIRAAEQAGYEIVVIDGLSPFWENLGGVLEIVDAATPKGGNKFTSGWSVGTPAYQLMVSAITHAPIHVVCTIRSKTEYAMQPNERGKMEPKKIGLAPVQRNGIEYEFDITAQLDEAHTAQLGARGPFEGRSVAQPGIGFGRQVREWLDTGTVSDD